MKYLLSFPLHIQDIRTSHHETNLSSLQFGENNPPGESYVYILKFCKEVENIKTQDMKMHTISSLAQREIQQPVIKLDLSPLLKK